MVDKKMTRSVFCITLSLAVLATCVTYAYAFPEANSLSDIDPLFHLHARGENKDGSTPVYKDPTANIEDRVRDLLARMTVEEKVAQL